MRASSILRTVALTACLQAASLAHAQCETQAAAKATVQASQERLRLLRSELTKPMFDMIEYSRTRAKELGWDPQRTADFHKRLLAGEVNTKLRNQLALLEPEMKEIAYKMRDADLEGDYLAVCPMAQKYDLHIETVKTAYVTLIAHIRAEADAMK